MRKLLSSFIAMTLVCSISVFSAAIVSAETTDWSYTGSDCTKNTSAAATINYILAKYPDGSQYTGDGQCYGWAEKISTMLASKRSTSSYKGLKLTKTNFLKKCKGLKAGAHLRISDKKAFDPYYGHSIVLLKVTSKKVYWTEANVGGYNNIRHGVASPEEFINYYGFRYLNRVTKTLSYRTDSEPALTAERNGEGKVKLFWTRTSSTEKYKVYRATSKKGPFSRVKTTTKKNYVDSTAKVGKKYYYKVKSVKSNRVDPVSNITSGKRKLTTPKVTSVSTRNKAGRIKLKWTKVPKASKYYIYRASLGSFEYKYLGASKTTSYTDKKAKNPNYDYLYKVKAIYLPNTQGNSRFSEPTDLYHPRLAAPKITYTRNPDTGKLTIKWEKISYADHYDIYLGTSKSEAWPYDGGFTKRSYTFNASDLVVGKKNYIWVVAKPEYDWTGETTSLKSNVLAITGKTYQ